MLETIQHAIREYIGNDNLQITAATRLADLRLDSLDTVELFIQLEDKLGVSIATCGDVDSVGDLVAAVEQARV